MFTLVHGDDLLDFPELTNQMFRDRRTQFSEVLGWDLKVDGRGREIDRYDLENPLYVILGDDDGRHLASSRVLPTTGPTMIADHFADLTDGVAIESPLIWEVTRFFVARRGRKDIRPAAALMWAGCRLALKSGVQFYVGVTGARMVPVFAACGWPAEVIGRRADPQGDICACLWEVTEALAERLRARAGIPAGHPDPRIHRRRGARPAPAGSPPAFIADAAVPTVRGAA